MDASRDASRPTPAKAPPRVTIVRESEADLGWLYEVCIVAPDGAETSHEVTLSWRDHDYWCHGLSAPSVVVRAVLEYALAHREGSLPASFDAARVRRWLPRIDQELRV